MTTLFLCCISESELLHLQTYPPIQTMRLFQEHLMLPEYIKFFQHL